MDYPLPVIPACIPNERWLQTHWLAAHAPGIVVEDDPSPYCPAPTCSEVPDSGFRLAQTGSCAHLGSELAGQDSLSLSLI